MPLDLRALPKVLLHEHLDGGLRPATVIDMALDVGYTQLPTQDAGELGAWFHSGANRGSLPLYLEGFAHTCAVMQTRHALDRVAFEFIEDMHRDGVVYAEARFAPCFHRERGLTDEAIVGAVLDGLRRGGEKYGVKWGLIICAMRNRTDSLEAAELAVNFRHHGVVGFDLAGEEAGHPPKKHVEAFHAIQEANFYSTLHAGEAFDIRGSGQDASFVVDATRGSGTVYAAVSKDPFSFDAVASGGEWNDAAFPDTARGGSAETVLTAVVQQMAPSGGRFDYDPYVSAPLLGINGISVVTHGRAKANMMRWAIAISERSVANGLVAAISSGAVAAA